MERAAAAVDGRSDPAISLAVDIGRWLPLPGSGNTARRWQMLSAIAAGDLTAAKVVEAHTDALAILAEAAADPDVDRDGLPPVPEGSSWGVFAAEGSGLRVDAQHSGGAWRLSGDKPWCSLADQLSHALITARTPSGERRLFAVALTDPAVRPGGTRWIARGLTGVPSGVLTLDQCPAVPVGPDGWYLRRPGFSWGGMGVAACWYGGAVGVARRLMAAARTRQPDQLALMHLGAVDTQLTAARLVLHAAAADIDGGAADGAAGQLLAARTRAVVSAAAEDVLRRVGHALGPAPLALEEEHARRIADLELFLRQHHAERDEAALGAQVLTLDTWPT